MRTLPHTLTAAILLLAASAALAERNYSAPAPASKAATLATLALDPRHAIAVTLMPLDADRVQAMRRENSAFGLRSLKLGTVNALPGLSTAPGMKWHAVPGGSAVQWRISAEGAQALRLRFTVERAPAAARLRFADDEVKGAYESPLMRGTHWGPVLHGQSATVEIFVPGNAPPGDLLLLLDEAAQFFVDPLEAGLDRLAKSTESQLCEVDFACRAGADPALASTGAAVARLTYISDGYVWACTGTLLNPANGSFTPYFYTAAHCVHDSQTAATASTLWFYETRACGSSQTREPVQLSGGAQLVVTDTNNDATLLRLNDMPPKGAVYAGWDSDPLPSATAIVGVHHPSGDRKKVSLGQAIPAGAFLSVTWTSGATEQGSSGSGLFTAAQGTRPDYLLRGALFGGTTACSGAPANAFDVYSRLDLAWPALAPYLGKPADANYTGVWWDSTDPGWGVAIEHQQGLVIATLFTYRGDGTAIWLAAPDMRLHADGSFTGVLYEALGSPFDATNWGPIAARPVGTMAIRFSAGQTARLEYNIDGALVAREIAPMLFGAALPTCALASGSRAKAENYQDQWWDPTQPGWGVSIAQQGVTLFVALFNYDDMREPLWVIAPEVRREADGTYAGTLYRTRRGAGAIETAAAGDIHLAFQDGERATLEYSIDGRASQKAITRLVAAPSAPLCK